MSLINGMEIQGVLADQLMVEMAAVSEVFDRHLKCEHESINELHVRYPEKYRGKMLRPTLVMLSGLASGQNFAGGTSDRRRGGRDDHGNTRP